MPQCRTDSCDSTGTNELYIIDDDRTTDRDYRRILKFIKMLNYGYQWLEEGETNLLIYNQ